MTPGEVGFLALGLGIGTMVLSLVALWVALTRGDDD